MAELLQERPQPCALDALGLEERLHEFAVGQDETGQGPGLPRQLLRIFQGALEYGFDYAFAVWGNSTLGLLSYWWHSSRQQDSKASMTIRQAETLPVLGFRALGEEQLAAAQRIFDEFRELDLQPAYLADADPNRALPDRRVIHDLLGFDEDTYRAVRRLAVKWCAEPSVHGGKARPKTAVYVE